MDKVDGPYYFFPLLKLLRDTLPAWLPLVGVDLGDTNVVPVDYVAKAMDHLAHLPDRDGEAFHLVNPEPQPVVELVNSFCAAAGAPQFAVPDRPQRHRPAAVGLVPRRAAAVDDLPVPPLRLSPVQVAARPDHRPARHPGRGARATSRSRRSSTRRHTEKALAGSGISVPDLESYAAHAVGLLGGEPRRRDRPGTPRPRKALTGKNVVITGASSGIGQVTALKVAQAGGVPVLVARGKEKLEDHQATDRAARRHGVRLPLRPLRPARDRRALPSSSSDGLPSIDFVVNNAGRSIRRSLQAQRRTASTTSSAPCSSTTSARSGW